jgi:hypothetical protein
MSASFDCANKYGYCRDVMRASMKEFVQTVVELMHPNGDVVQGVLRRKLARIYFFSGIKQNTNDF